MDFKTSKGSAVGEIPQVPCLWRLLEISKMLDLSDLEGDKQQRCYNTWPILRQQRPNPCFSPRKIPESPTCSTSTAPHVSLRITRQKLTTLSPAPEPSDWSAVSINTDLYLGTIRSSVSNLMNKFQEELKRLYGKGETASVTCVEEKF